MIDTKDFLGTVPQKELSGDQAYWLSANEIASQASKSATPGTLLSEHTKVLELEAEISKQKQCIDTSSASNAIFEINKLRQQLQGKDDTIRNLDAQINIMKVLNVGSTEGSCDQQALETDRIQLKDTITSLRIQLDGLKVENVSLKRRYDELSKANTHSRTAYTEKLSALTAGNNQLKAQVTGKTSSGPSTSETPKVLAPGMYNLGSKYIPPPKRANWVKPTPLPKKKQVTFSEPPRPSLKPTQKPVVHPNKQTNVCVPMSTGVKPTSGASKTVPKRAPRNHSSLPAKSTHTRKVEAPHRTLNKQNCIDSNLLVKHSVSVSNLNNVCGACNKSLVFANHNDCLVMCDDSVNVKPHQTKRLKRQPKKEWKPIKNVGKPIKRVWKPISKPVANSKPQWKPTGRHFSLFEKYPLTRIMEPTDMPIELPPSASSSPQITMVSRFTDHKLSDRKTGSTNKLFMVIWIPRSSRHMTGEPSRVYYVKGTQANLFLRRQFCDGGLEVAFLRQHSMSQSAQRLWWISSKVKARKSITSPTNYGKTQIAEVLPYSTYGPLRTNGNRKLSTERSHVLVIVDDVPPVWMVFGSLCYPTNDYDDVGKLKAKADIGIFVGYAPTKKAYRIYNKRTRKIQETVHVAFDELTEGLTSVQTGDMCVPRFDDDEVVPIPPVVPITPVNVPAAPAPENAIGSPSTTVISEGAPAVTKPLPHQILSTRH
ncbi:hypothetical protein Tco_0639148 [Tanacetum coccineum]